MNEQEFLNNISNSNPNVTSQQNNNLIELKNDTRINNDVTEYFSVQSELFDANENSFKSASGNDLNILISKDDSFDSQIVITSDKKRYEKEYKLMEELINASDFDKLAEIDLSILLKEISRRKNENIKRLEKLKKLEDKMETVKVLNEFNSNVDRNDNEKANLVLSNIKKDQGYYIVRNEEIIANFDEQLFCSNKFYTKK